MTPGPIGRDHEALRYPANPSHGGLQYRLDRAEAAGTGDDCSDSEVKGKSTESTNTPVHQHITYLLSFPFLLLFGPHFAQGLFLALSSMITPSRIWGTTWDVGDRIWIGQVKASALATVLSLWLSTHFLHCQDYPMLFPAKVGAGI